MARKGYKCKTIDLPDGTRKYIYGKTKEDLEQKYIEACIQLRAGVDLKNHDTFGEFAQLWFNTYKKGTVLPRTEVQYKRVLNVHIMPHLAGYRMKDITPMMIMAIFRYMDKQKKGVDIQKQTYQILSSIFSVAVDNGVISRSPITKRVTYGGRPRAKRRAIDSETIKLLLDTVKGTQAEPFVVIALHTGMRRGEILGLQWEDVNLKKKEIHVRHNNHFGNKGATIVAFGKTDAAERTIPFGAEVLAQFKVLEKDREGGCVFHGSGGKPVGQSEWEKLWRPVKKLKMGHDLTPHILRHTAITRWIEGGMDIKAAQYLAGHASASITMDIYADYIAESRSNSTREKILSISSSL